MNAKFNPRATTLLVVSLFIFAVLATACGAGSPPAPTSTPTTTPAAPTSAAPAPTAKAAHQVLDCGKGRGEMTVPKGGQIFWSNHRVDIVDPYAVVYDPTQGGSSDHPAYGWWYQPCLPAGPDRQAHEVSITLQAGKHRFTGPECRVWLNADGQSPWEAGKLIISRQNVLSMMIDATTTAGTEAWVAVKCNTSWASGFSFERLEPMP